MAVLAPVRNRTRVMVSVPRDEWDETRVELDTLRREVAADCALIVADLDRLIPAALEVGPPALHWLGSASHRAARLRMKVTR